MVTSCYLTRQCIVIPEVNEVHQVNEGHQVNHVLEGNQVNRHFASVLERRAGRSGELGGMDVQLLGLLRQHRECEC